MMNIPIEKAWAFLKDDIDDVVSEDMDRVEPSAPQAPWEQEQEKTPDENGIGTDFHPKLEALMRLLGIII